MKNKGFVLMETIIVIVVISVALLTIFSSYNKILRKVKTENKYDTSEYIYMTEYIKKYLSTSSLSPIKISDINETNIDDNEYSDLLSNNNFDVKKIYILKGLDNVGEHAKYFDAYMIDYLRRLDVGAEDELIIVEYKRPALKTNGDQKKDSLTNPLYETYIASLEW